MVLSLLCLQAGCSAIVGRNVTMLQKCPYLHCLKVTTLPLSCVLPGCFCHLSLLSFSGLQFSSFLSPLHFFLLITQLFSCLWPSVFSCIPKCGTLPGNPVCSVSSAGSKEEFTQTLKHQLHMAISIGANFSLLPALRAKISIKRNQKKL